MDIVMKKVGCLIPYENNPRYNEDAIQYVEKSIEQYGFLIPIVITKDNVIVAGDTRRKAAIRLKIEEVPCIVADHLTDEQIRAFRLVDNKTAEFATWDFSKLAEELSQIVEIDLSIYKFPEFAEEDLKVQDSDFLQDTEIVKDRGPKKVKCPHCGKEFDL